MEEARKIVLPPPPEVPQPRDPEPDMPRAQALATPGLAYAVLAAYQYLPRLEPSAASRPDRRALAWDRRSSLTLMKPLKVIALVNILCVGFFGLGTPKPPDAG